MFVDNEKEIDEDSVKCSYCGEYKPCKLELVIPPTYICEECYDSSL